MNNAQIKQVQDMTIKQLDGLKTLVENTLVEWNETNIPLNFLHKAIVEAKINPRKQNIKAARDYFLQFNKTLSVLEKLCKKNAESMNVKHIPLTVFNKFVDHIKTVFLESSNKNMD